MSSTKGIQKEQTSRVRSFSMATHDIPGETLVLDSSIPGTENFQDRSSKLWIMLISASILYLIFAQVQNKRKL